MYVWMYVHVCMYVYMYLHIHKYTHTHPYVCIICIHIRTTWQVRVLVLRSSAEAAAVESVWDVQDPAVERRVRDTVRLLCGT